MKTSAARKQLAMAKKMMEGVMEKGGTADYVFRKIIV
jgi:hypothetical protein